LPFLNFYDGLFKTMSKELRIPSEGVMAYWLKIDEAEVLGEGKYVNAKGNTECVEFVRQATGAPHTSSWTRGSRVSEAKPGEIDRGTAIATFDTRGRYPTDNLGKHAAVYLSHDARGIFVLDQWNKQGEVKKRQIKFNGAKGISRSDNADFFYVIE
jgi:hypothetical protein